MPENKLYPPEGLWPRSSLTLPALREAVRRETILAAPVIRCDSRHSLTVDLGDGLTGVIPREEASAPWISGADRDIALLSLVGKQVCFLVTEAAADEKGAPLLRLSRRAVQERAREDFLTRLRPGDVVTGVVTHLEPFGAFVDIGCGVVAMLPVEHLSVARIPHPAARLHPGQRILAAVSAADPDLPRFTLTMKELLGTWLENASRFSPGDTVPGIVRAVKPYGCFVELAPNLSGLADLKDGVREGDRVSVYIKTIRPERMKMKLHIIQRLARAGTPAPPRYQLTDGPLARWTYSPPNYEGVPVETVFSPASD